MNFQHFFCPEMAQIQVPDRMALFSRPLPFLASWGLLSPPPPPGAIFQPPGVNSTTAEKQRQAAAVQPGSGPTDIQQCMQLQHKGFCKVHWICWYLRWVEPGG